MEALCTYQRSEPLRIVQQRFAILLESSPIVESSFRLR